MSQSEVEKLPHGAGRTLRREVIGEAWLCVFERRSYLIAPDGDVPPAHTRRPRPDAQSRDRVAREAAIVLLGRLP